MSNISVHDCTEKHHALKQEKCNRRSSSFPQMQVADSTHWSDSKWEAQMWLAHWLYRSKYLIWEKHHLWEALWLSETRPSAERSSWPVVNGLWQAGWRASLPVENLSAGHPRLRGSSSNWLAYRRNQLAWRLAALARWLAWPANRLRKSRLAKLGVAVAGEAQKRLSRWPHRNRGSVSRLIYQYSGQPSILYYLCGANCLSLQCSWPSFINLCDLQYIILAIGGNVCHSQSMTGNEIEALFYCENTSW